MALRILSLCLIVVSIVGCSTTDTQLKISDFQQSVRKDLRYNILPFWIHHTLDQQKGGFIGRMTNDRQVIQDAPKGLVLNTRILWTYSAAYRFETKPEYLTMAQRAYDYLMQNFWDTEYGGAYWLLDSNGQPQDDMKKLYGESFVIYSLSEFHRATGNQEALSKAQELFKIIETKCHDAKNQGYFEMYNRDWTLSEQPSIGAGEPRMKKSMNAHLHLMEAYTNLYRVWKDDLLRRRLKELIEVFRDHIIDSETYHFKLFFDETWDSEDEIISFGHDIEGSWLLPEAAEVLGDEEMIMQMNGIALKMAQACYEQALDPDGALLYEADLEKIINTDKHWWPQAETVVGFLNAYQMSGERDYFDAAFRCWQFIENFLVDHEHGEWFSIVSRDAVPNLQALKVSEWKAPYHNARCCFETIHRLESIAK
jgi:cellobiose epimerase